ncbi:MAG: biotin carboxylase N-terminal domain-containing protein [Candidatus Promineifilaceae bacterium]
MFRKILIANRGEIALRIIRTCREMGISTLTLYEPSDKDSLHVRLADECVQLDSPADYFDIGKIIHIARDKEADAIHPGYGFLAERSDFIQACDEANLAFIGPPAEQMARIEDKIETLRTIQAAGFPTVTHSNRSFGPDEYEALEEEAAVIEFPLIIKSSRGGRGRGERLVTRPEKLAQAVRRAQAESQAVYGSRQLYLERAILPAHQIGVQILADQNGRIIHLGEREGSILAGNQKIIEESPAPGLTMESRQALWMAAINIARLINFQNAGTVEFLVDEDGRYYFSEIKARLQADHTLTEMRTGIDLVREQLRIAAAEPVIEQANVTFSGWAMLARIRAEKSWDRFMPCPGRLTQVRFPGGHGIRIDSHAADRFYLSAAYDPLIAKITVCSPERVSSINRLRSALEECRLVGTDTNLSLLLWALQTEAFTAGRADTELLAHRVDYLLPSDVNTLSSRQLQELAVTAAFLYLHRTRQIAHQETPPPFTTGWHQSSRFGGVK